MATKKKAKKEETRKIVSDVTLDNGIRIVTYADGAVTIFPAQIDLTADEAKEIFGANEEEEEEEDEEEEEEDEEDSDDDDDDSDDEEEEEEEEDDEEEEEDEEDEEEEEEELTGEDLANMDFEELEDVCDDKDLEVDPEDYEEDDIEKFRKAIAKELGIKLPAKAKKESKKKGKK